MVDVYTGDSKVTTFVANVGDLIKICRPLGYPFKIRGQLPEGYTPTNTSAYGFTVVDSELGEFEDIGSLESDTACVYYRHKKSGRQVIKYKSRGSITETEFYAIVQGITIHDHASVYTGGPAYATYYAELPEEEAEEE